MAYWLITNNACVEQQYNSSSDRLLKKTLYMPDAELIGVLTCVRDLVHQGHELLTHPLTGSVKPYETPFKSICVSAQTGPIHFASVTLIEEAINTANKFLKDRRSVVYPETVLEDFRLIDLSLISSGIESIHALG